MSTQTKIAKGATLSCITVSNLSKAKKLFVDILGLEVKDYQEEYQWMEVAGDEGSLIGIGQETPQGDSSEVRAGANAIISIEVYQLEKAIEHLKKYHIQFHGEIIEIPHEVRMILFEDFDGNRFFLTESLK